jgi:solute carrier family 41
LASNARLLFFVEVTTSLFLARSLTNYLWSKKLDPDLYALPIHSALMDLIGQLLLVLCFEIVSLIRGNAINDARYSLSHLRFR